MPDLRRSRSKAQRTLVKSVSWCGRCRRSERCSLRFLFVVFHIIARKQSYTRNETLNSLCGCPQYALFCTRSYPLGYDTSIPDVWVVSRVILNFFPSWKSCCISRNGSKSSMITIS